MPFRLAVILACALAAGCTDKNEPTNPPPDGAKPIDAPSSPPDTPPGNCVSFAGRWLIAGSCGADLCTVTQVGCAITAVTCTSGAHSSTGSIDGSRYSYTGTSGAGNPATCNGTISGTTTSGSCLSLGVTCTFTGDRQQ